MENEGAPVNDPTENTMKRASDALRQAAATAPENASRMQLITGTIGSQVASSISRVTYAAIYGAAFAAFLVTIPTGRLLAAGRTAILPSRNNHSALKGPRRA